ncbi:SDR family oxidoreductase [Streptomyces niveus]|uniref:Uncharacterized protein n=1 Tax=Streptomyces niveus TaxID=193462 RepID=A0A1U9QZQ0_STRNV|nr:SDR family oxidoreductase [Streptomyces niveus]AQU69569.1 hypothetical protein BBN63_28650 [Streptomyces niveus]
MSERYEDDRAVAGEPDVRPGDIAVVGMHGRFPGARDCDEFWRRVSAGDDCVGFHSDAELRAAGVPEALIGDERYVKSHGGLDEPFGFDPEFFGYSAREGELMDPQQRIFLETAWELLEMTGYAGTPGEPVVGVFAGASMNTYLTNVLARSVDLLSLEGTEIMLTNDKDYLPTRVSYKLGLTGPSVNVQSGCSTSLVAVHLAVQSLVGGECDIALAGGVSVHVSPRPGYLYQEGLMFSPDGRCRPFDSEASGTAFGDGVGIVALKRLGDALDDGDQILAVVKGTAVNNDGSRKVGFTAPGVAGQSDVITEAHAVAEVPSRSIGYMEAHGTGTALGDPVEFAALREAFGSDTSDTAFCALGSVKANVGHLAGAAGIAGFIKAVLAVRHGMIPPHPHFTSPHPELELDKSPFYISDRLLPWPSDGGPRRAGVSSFGMGGTNAHAVLEEPPPARPAGTAPGGPSLIPVSAATPGALGTALAALADRLESADAPSLADTAHTLRTGRRAFPHRYAVRATTHREAADRLRAAARLPHAQAVGFAPPVTLVLGGTPDTGLAALAAEVHQVRTTLERAARLLADSGVPDALVTAAVSGAPAGPGDPAVRDIAGFLSAYAHATLWTGSGLRPATVAGAGAGELAAACVAGVLTLAEALAVLAHRAGFAARPPRPGTGPGRTSLLSAVSGAPFDPATAGAEHWTEDIWTAGRLPEAVAAGAPEDGIVLTAGLDPVLTSAVRTRTAGTLVTVPGTAGSAELTPEHLLDTAGRLWTAGVEVDWTRWTGGAPRRVPLPTHPLERRRLVREPEAPADPARQRTDDPERWLYTESWQRAGSLRRDTAPPTGRWLLFEDEGGVGEGLRAALAGHGIDAVAVRAGDRYARTGPSAFTLDPDDPDGPRALFAALAAEGGVPDRIVHLWTLDDEDGASGEPPTPERFERAQRRGLYSVLETATAVSGTPRTGGTRISVVARGLFDVLGGERPDPATSTVTAAARVVPQEFTGIACHCVDPGPGPVSGRELLAELAGPGDETHVALRRGHRWVQRFRSLDRPGAGGRVALKEGGVYLITGGLGGIGLTLAGHLASAYGAKLVLTGRTAMPEPAEYADWLDTHGPGHPEYARVRTLSELAARAGGLLTVAADVTDRGAMAAAVDLATGTFGRVDGWIHAAGVPLADAVQWIGTTDRAAWRATMAPKVLGALVLEDVFAGRPVDFGCLVSSLASVVGGTGYAAYAAANTFLDTLALSHEQLLSVDWEAWDLPGPDAGTAETGGGTPDAGGSAAVRELRALALRPKDGIDAFELLMRNPGERRLAVSTVDLEARRIRWAGPPDGAKPAGGAAPVAADLGPGLEQRLAEVWGDVLRTDIDRYDVSLFDMGGDSLLIVELALRIEERLGIPTQATDLLEAPTVDHLAARIRADAGETTDDDAMAKADQRAVLRSRRRSARRDRKDRDA